VGQNVQRRLRRQRPMPKRALRYTILDSAASGCKQAARNSPMLIRQATLDDTRQIVALFSGRVPVWQRLNEQGQVEDLPYDALSIYERWLHGGAWMSLETGSIWLSHVLSGNGLAFVMVDDGRVLAYAEAFLNRELTPMGSHLHLAELLVDERCSDDDHHNLADTILSNARAPGRLSVAHPDYDNDLATYFRRYFGASEAFRLTRYSINAQIGQSFYKSQEYTKTEASQIDDWALAVGRWTSPRALWESEWIEHWRGIPQIIARSKHRHYINASGHEALVCFHQQLYNERSADVYCWSPRHLSTQLLVAIRDMGHRLGFRSLTLALPEAAAELLPPENTADPNQQVIATVSV